ncbi:1-acyl-sn-glycerol-3-phosphate acyltransferase [Lentilactobacillus hilgardii]|nr:lysophospholipid acyltransferase family protein [Lentilactobacillus hilgardii]MCV3741328.1 1-acyl-sn-glycerol-3-phosphate acyltransferase [Lentilactobacillus hilgardii]
MLFYKLSRLVLHCYLFILLGPIKVKGKEKLPTDQPFILVAPHHYWWDAMLYAVYLAPINFFFVAKYELFDHAFFAKVLRHLNAVPVQRNTPNTATLQTTINHLKEKNNSLIIFPTGSRYSNILRSGYLVIAQKSGRPVVPVTFTKLGWGFNYISVGNPYLVKPTSSLSHSNRNKYNHRLNQKFSDLLKTY